MRFQDLAYLAYIREQSCCECHRPAPSEPHHCSFVDGTGQGTKASDLFVIPVCRVCHDYIESMGIRDKYYATLTMLRLLAKYMEAKNEL